MGKFWVIAKIFSFLRNNPSVFRDIGGILRGAGPSEDRTRDQRELELNIRRIEGRVDALEKTLNKAVTALYAIAAVALAALLLAIIKLA